MTEKIAVLLLLLSVCFHLQEFCFDLDFKVQAGCKTKTKICKERCTFKTSLLFGSDRSPRCQDVICASVQHIPQIMSIAAFYRVLGRSRARKQASKLKKEHKKELKRELNRASKQESRQASRPGRQASRQAGRQACKH